MNVNHEYIHFAYIKSRISEGRVLDKAVSWRSLTEQGLIPFLVTSYGIYCGQIGTGPVLRPFPVSIIPPTFHIHSIFYPRRSIVSITDRVFEENSTSSCGVAVADSRTATVSLILAVRKQRMSRVPLVTLLIKSKRHCQKIQLKNRAKYFNLKCVDVCNVLCRSVSLIFIFIINC